MIRLSKKTYKNDLNIKKYVTLRFKIRIIEYSVKIFVLKLE